MGPTDWILRGSPPRSRPLHRRVLVSCPDVGSAMRAVAAAERLTAPSGSGFHLLHVQQHKRPARRSRWLRSRGIHPFVRVGDLPPYFVGPSTSYLAARSAEEADALGGIGTTGPAADREAQALAHLCQHLRDAGHTSTLTIRFGSLGKEILKICRSENIDLVVMSAARDRVRAWSALNRAIRRVPRESEIPVLLVQGDKRLARPEPGRQVK